jgi:hypothetical protein
MRLLGSHAEPLLDGEAEYGSLNPRESPRR